MPEGDGPVPDWQSLRRAAAGAAARAYAPYSHLRVGAAGLCQDGQVVAGCNVENASYGLTLCAECSLVSAVVAGGHGRLVAVSVVSGDGRPLAPCGRCRQLLLEHGGPDLLLDSGVGSAPERVGHLLPQAFEAGELARSSDKPAADPALIKPPADPALNKPPARPRQAKPSPAKLAHSKPFPATPAPTTPAPTAPESDKPPVGPPQAKQSPAKPAAAGRRQRAVR